MRPLLETDWRPGPRDGEGSLEDALLHISAFARVGPSSWGTLSPFLPRLCAAVSFTTAQVYAPSSTFPELTQPDTGSLGAPGVAVQTGQLRPKDKFTLDYMVVSKEFKLAVDIYKPERLLSNSRFPAPRECSEDLAALAGIHSNH